MTREPGRGHAAEFDVVAASEGRPAWRQQDEVVPGTEAGRAIVAYMRQWSAPLEREAKILAIETESWNAALAAVEEAVRDLEFDNERDGQPSSGVYQDLLSRLAALRKGASE